MYGPLCARGLPGTKRDSLLKGLCWPLITGNFLHLNHVPHNGSVSPFRENCPASVEFNIEFSIWVEKKNKQNKTAELPFPYKVTNLLRHMFFTTVKIPVNDIVDMKANIFIYSLSGFLTKCTFDIVPACCTQMCVDAMLATLWRSEPERRAQRDRVRSGDQIGVLREPTGQTQRSTECETRRPMRTRARMHAHRGRPAKSRSKTEVTDSGSSSHASQVALQLSRYHSCAHTYTHWKASPSPSGALFFCTLPPPSVQPPSFDWSHVCMRLFPFLFNQHL